MTDLNQKEYNKFKTYFLICIILTIFEMIYYDVEILFLLFTIICLFKYIIPCVDIKYEQNDIKRKMPFWKKIYGYMVVMGFGLILSKIVDQLLILMVDQLYYILSNEIFYVIIVTLYGLLGGIISCGLIYECSSYYPGKFGYKYIWARFFIVGFFLTQVGAGILYAYYRNMYINNLNNQDRLNKMITMNDIRKEII